MVLVLGQFTSPEQRERLQHLRSMAAPAPRPAPSFAMGYGPGGKGGRSDVSPSEGSAMMLDNYGHLLSPKDETIEQVKAEYEQMMADREEINFDDFDGSQRMSQEEVDAFAEAFAYDYIRGIDPQPLDVPMSDADTARVQHAIYEQVQNGIAAEFEDLSQHFANMSTEAGTPIDTLRQWEDGYELKVGENTYKLDGNALIETQPDGIEMTFDADAMDIRIQDIRDAAKELGGPQQETVPVPTPKAPDTPTATSQALEMTPDNREKIASAFRDSMAAAQERFAPMHQQRAERAAAREAAAAGRNSEPNSEPAPARSDVQAAVDMPEAQKPSEAQVTAQRVSETLQEHRVITPAGQRFAVEAKAPTQSQSHEQAPTLSPAQQAAQSASAAIQPKQGNALLVDMLSKAPEGTRIRNTSTGTSYRVEGENIIASKNGQDSSSMNFAEFKQRYEPTSAKQPSIQKETAAVSQPGAQQEKSVTSAPAASAKPQHDQKPQQQSQSLARASQGGGQSAAQTAAVQAAQSLEASAARAATQATNQQKNRGQELA
ncbi:hypothetical protein FY136_28765 (plasmid) [Agrobacterium tumefaciens]|nr:hypothetical protein FY136_28765 [Agrobacterium tumefaciens]